MNDETKIEVGSRWRRKDGDGGSFTVMEIGEGFRGGTIRVAGAIEGRPFDGWVGVDYWLNGYKPDPDATPSAPDPVDHPPHYKGTAVEPIDAIEAWGLGFVLGNVIKYVARAGRKGDRIEDLRKAKFYLDRAIEKGATKP